MGCLYVPKGVYRAPYGGVALLWGVQGCRGGIDGPSMDVQPLLGIQGPARLWGAAVGSHRDPIGPVGPHSAWLGGASPSKYGHGHAHVGSHAPRPYLPPPGPTSPQRPPPPISERRRRAGSEAVGWSRRRTRSDWPRGGRRGPEAGRREQSAAELSAVRERRGPSGAVGEQKNPLRGEVGLPVGWQAFRSGGRPFS